VHLNSSGLGFCRLDDAMKGSNELRQRARSLGLSDDDVAVQQAMQHVRQEIARARDPGIEATKQEALRRARSREAAAGAIALLSQADVSAGKTVYVAGDFNTPLEEPCKTGSKIEEDFDPPAIGCNTSLTPASRGTRDGFDDTFAVLSSGMIGGLRFRVLTEGIGRTYARGNFVDSPIDNMLVAGSNATHRAVKLGQAISGAVFGSDHYPVLVTRAP
jgi:hypothetical protein